MIKRLLFFFSFIHISTQHDRLLSSIQLTTTTTTTKKLTPNSFKMFQYFSVPNKISGQFKLGKWRKLSAKRDLSIMYQTKLMATNIAYTLLGDGGKKKASILEFLKRKNFRGRTKKPNNKDLLKTSDSRSNDR
ncbi:hypothetical protein AAHE18_08G069100 [Arachis hypogaea]